MGGALQIREWPAEDRPRERLYHKGAEALADAELLAIQLGTGVPGLSSMDVAREILAQHGSLSAVAALGVAELAHVRGIGRVRAIRLAAAFEITRRLRSRNGTSRVVLSSPEQVFARYGPLMEDLKKEVFRVALLDSQNGLLRDVVISEGTLSASLVHRTRSLQAGHPRVRRVRHLAAQSPERGSVAEPRGPSAHAAIGRLLEAARSPHPRPRHHRPRAVRELSPSAAPSERRPARRRAFLQPLASFSTSFFDRLCSLTSRFFTRRSDV